MVLKHGDRDALAQLPGLLERHADALLDAIGDAGLRAVEGSWYQLLQKLMQQLTDETWRGLKERIDDMVRNEDEQDEME